MKRRAIVLILAILVIALALILGYQRRIQFEFYSWDLSSQSLATREMSATSIIQMGNYAVPILIGKLDHPYIFETAYDVYCLEEITKAELTYDRGHFDMEREAIPFWKDWWKKNEQRFE